MTSSLDLVARGRIRVDALRAVAKLREHLLVDLHAYLLEVLRAAVILGAKHIEISNDADDLYVRFDGSPLSPSHLERLLDFAVQEAQDPSSSALRLLALGVNAALGLRPAHVDVYTSKGSDGVQRIRFSTDLFESAEGQSPARLSSERADPPDGQGVVSTCLHLKRRFGWATMRQFFTGGPPREVELALAATDNLRASLRLNGSLPQREGRDQRILRIDLPGWTHATLFVTKQAEVPATVEFLEREVRMIACSLPTPWQGTFLGVNAPIRAFFDCETLPTNASRSALREDSDLATRANAAILESIQQALLALRHLVTAKGECPASVQILDNDAIAAENALGAFACVLHGASKLGSKIPTDFAWLFDLPLFRDGIGRERSPAQVLAQMETGPVYAHRGDKPLAMEFGPWMAQVVWLRGRIAERLIPQSDLGNIDLILPDIQEGMKRRKRLFAHLATGPVVPDSPHEVVRDSFEFDSGPRKGLRGQLCVRLPGSAPEQNDRLQMRVFVEDHLIETIEFDEGDLRMPIDIAVAWDGKLVPTNDYTAIQRTEAVHVALRVAQHLAVRALGRVATTVEQLDPAERGPICALLRAATGSSSVATHINHFPIWPTSDGRWISLDELADGSKKTGSVCIVGRADSVAYGSAIDNRAVVIVDQLEARWLQASLGPDLALVPYEAGIEGAARVRDNPLNSTLWGVLDGELRRQASLPGPTMAFVRPGCRGWITVSRESSIIRTHLGILLTCLQRKAGGATIIVDEDVIVPSPAWNGVLHPPTVPNLEAVEFEFCDLICAAVSGDQVSESITFPPSPASLSTDSQLRVFLLETVARLRTAGDQTGQLKRIEQLPLLTMLDESGTPVATSIATVEASFVQGKSIVVLDAVPGFATLDWRPIVVSQGRERSAFNVLFPSRVSEGTPQLAERKTRSDSFGAFRELMSSPVESPCAPSARCTEGLPFALLQDNMQAFLHGLTGTVAPLDCRDGNLNDGVSWLRLCYQGHTVCETKLPGVEVPVGAWVNVTDSALLKEWNNVGDAGRGLITQCVRASLEPLGIAIIRSACTQEHSHLLFNSLPALEFIALLFQKFPQARHSLNIPWRDVWCPTVQGPTVHWSKLLLRNETTLCVGSEQHAAWIGPSQRSAEFDQPILYLPSSPEGDCLRSFLPPLGYLMLEDVTQAVRKLQTLRRAGKNTPPGLPGSPPHPLLRADLSTFGVDGAEGELEITAGPESDVALVDFDGTTRRVPAALPLPVRAVIRVSTTENTPEDANAIMLRLSRASIRHLDSLTGHLNELPIFVRTHLKSILCRRLRQGKKVPENNSRAPVFEDIHGQFHSFEELRAQPGAVLCTSSEPPYPRRNYDAVVVQLSHSDQSHLASHIQLEDFTESLQKDLEGENRAIAPQVVPALASRVRERCVRIVSIDDDGTVGEIGILSPGYCNLRNIQVLAEGRALCQVQDGEGWPLCAVVNEATARPNRYHDALEDPYALQGIQSKVRRAGLHAIRKLLEPPANALASRWIEEESIGTARVTGTLWLPAVWPTRPEVSVWDLGTTPRMRALSGASFRQIDTCAPVGGALMVRAVGEQLSESDWSELGRVAWREANAMVVQAAQQGIPASVLDPYRWNAAIIANQSCDLTATAASGKKVTAGMIRAESVARGYIWIAKSTSQAQAASFPGPPPDFVLLDDGGPLVQLLQLRAANCLRYVRAPISGGPTAKDEPSGVPQRSNPAEQSWLEALQSRLEAAFGNESEPAQPDDPLRKALEMAIQRLPSQPVVTLQFVKKGRPIRFSAHNAQLIVNRSHPSLSLLIGSPTPQVLRVLAAAALAEISRELDSVTDAEEQRALIELMKSAKDSFRIVS